MITPSSTFLAWPPWWIHFIALLSQKRSCFSKLGNILFYRNILSFLINLYELTIRNSQVLKELNLSIFYLIAMVYLKSQPFLIAQNLFFFWFPIFWQNYHCYMHVLPSIRMFRLLPLKSSFWIAILVYLYTSAFFESAIKTILWWNSR